MRTHLFAILALWLILLVTAPTAADIPGIDLCYAELPEGPLPRFLMVVPDGSGPPLSEARIDGGAIFSAVITATLIDWNGDPIHHYPASDMWLTESCGGLGFCGFAHPDGPTDVNGQTTFTGPYPLGGHMPDECRIQVVVAGLVFPGPGLELRLNSPDIDGDLEVHLSDIVWFAQAIGEYHWAADYNADGLINLSDIALFSMAIGAECP